MTPRRRRHEKTENPATATPSAPPDPAAASAADGGWLTVGVVSIGGASLLSDSSHEMVTSLLPTFLTTTLGAGPAALGAIDGVADALTGVCKLAGGPLANDPDRRGRLAAGGYLGTAVATAAIGLTVAHYIPFRAIRAGKHRLHLRDGRIMVIVKIGLGVGPQALLGNEGEARRVVGLHVVELRLVVDPIAAFVAAAPDDDTGAVLVALEGFH